MEEVNLWVFDENAEIEIIKLNYEDSEILLEDLDWDDVNFEGLEIERSAVDDMTTQLFCSKCNKKYKRAGCLAKNEQICKDNVFYFLKYLKYIQS